VCSYSLSVQIAAEVAAMAGMAEAEVRARRALADEGAPSTPIFSRFVYVRRFVIPRQIFALRPQLSPRTKRGRAQKSEWPELAHKLKEPKSGQVRTIALSPWVVAELRAHRARQAEALLRLGIRLNDDSFMVAQADGSPYKPSSISKEWRLQVRKLGLRRIRFHDLRHTHGSHMLASNVHPKIASERLGHSRVGITLDLYSHVVEGLQETAVALVDDAMAKALQKRATELG
jgi:integrase